MSQSMQVLTSQATNEWYTPPWIMPFVRETLGVIDLDPASNPRANCWIQANRYFDERDDGLSKEWRGRVFLNPPFSNTPKWVAKLMAEYEAGRVTSAILLVNSAPGYKWFEDLWRKYPVCCAATRMRFVAAGSALGSEKDQQSAGGQAKKGQTFAYLGPDVARFADRFRPIGRVILPGVEAMEASSLLYRMARLIRNPDGMAPTDWGAEGMQLLAELREMDPAKYDQYVKGPSHGKE